MRKRELLRKFMPRDDNPFMTITRRMQPGHVAYQTG
jgi:hypothetical protein